MKANRFFLSLIFIGVIEIGCGVKSKPLAPLKEPWISTGDLEKDKEKKYKSKRPPVPTDERIEFNPPPPPDENER